MKMIQTRRQKGKVNILRQESVKKVMEQEGMFDAKATMIQTLIPIAFDNFVDQLKKEVQSLAGDLYSRQNQASRWGSQQGSVYLGDEKLRVEIPRLRDTVKNKEVPLQTYTALQNPRNMDEGLMKKVLLGLSTGRYDDVARQTPEAFGLSKSAVSRRFIRASARKLELFLSRRLEKEDIVAVFLDGKSFQEDAMILAVGITLEGKKIMLGFIQSASENKNTVKEFLEKLIARGLSFKEGLLFIIDGSKGIQKGIREVFGKYGLLQRCQWHKRQNVLSYLPKNLQSIFKQKLSDAHHEPDYAKAKEKLSKIRKELVMVNRSAAESLDEGQEETLTIQKLGLFEELGRSFKTTNVIESIQARIGQHTDKVDYWKNSGQKQRWYASSLLDLEPRLCRVSGWKYLRLLKEALKRELNLEEKIVLKEAA